MPSRSVCSGAAVSLPITPESVAERVKEILTNGDDPEIAHNAEDTLMEEVIRCVALGSTQSQSLAGQLLPLLDSERTRGYA